MSTAVASKTLPMPLCKLTAHPLLWIKNKILLLVAAAVLAYIGMLAAAGTYYLLFEVNGTMTTLWHQMVPDPNLRHSIRNIGEGLYGGLFAQAVVWNHYKKRKPELSKLDKLEIRLHVANIKDDKPLSVPQLLATPLLVLVFAAPGFLFAYYAILPLLHSLFTGVHEIYVVFQPVVQASMNPRASTVLDKITSLFTQNIDKKLLGYGASLCARRAVKGVFDDLQFWFVDRRVRADKQPPSWYPAPFQARYNQVKVVADRPNGLHELDNRSTYALRAGLMFGIVVALGLAALGLYVLLFVAK